VSSLTSSRCTFVGEICKTHSMKKMLAVVMLLLNRSKAVQYTFSKLREHSLLVRAMHSIAHCVESAVACTADCQQEKLVWYLLPLEQPHFEEVLIVGVSHSTQRVGLHVGESAPVPVEACWQQPLTWKLLIQPSAAQHTSSCAGKLGVGGACSE